MIGIHYLEKWEGLLSKRALKKVLYLKEVLLLYSSKVFFFFFNSGWKSNFQKLPNNQSFKKNNQFDYVYKNHF